MVRDFALSSPLSADSPVHNQIGFMAEQFLHPYTTSILQEILEPKYNGSIGRAAAWADAYAHTEEGRFSYQWHWIDSHDDPPNSCSLNYTRDCSKGGCVVSAIANQTVILKGCVEDVKAGNLNGGANLTCSYALKWVSHYLGDIAQPLHASGRAAGGNKVPVVFNNVSTELHAVSVYCPFLLPLSLTRADLGRAHHPPPRKHISLLQPHHRPLLLEPGLQNPQRPLLRSTVYVARVQRPVDTDRLCDEMGVRKQRLGLRLRVQSARQLDGSCHERLCQRRSSYRRVAD